MERTNGLLTASLNKRNELIEVRFIHHSILISGYLMIARDINSSDLQMGMKNQFTNFFQTAKVYTFDIPTLVSKKTTQ